MKIVRHVRQGSCYLSVVTKPGRVHDLDGLRRLLRYVKDTAIPHTVGGAEQDPTVALLVGPLEASAADGLLSTLTGVVNEEPGS